MHISVVSDSLLARMRNLPRLPGSSSDSSRTIHPVDRPMEVDDCIISNFDVGSAASYIVCVSLFRGKVFRVATIGQNERSGIGEDAA